MRSPSVFSKIKDSFKIFFSDSWNSLLRLVRILSGHISLLRFIIAWLWYSFAGSWRRLSECLQKCNHTKFCFMVPDLIFLNYHLQLLWLISRISFFSISHNYSFWSCDGPFHIPPFNTSSKLTSGFLGLSLHEWFFMIFENHNIIALKIPIFLCFTWQWFRCWTT